MGAGTRWNQVYHFTSPVLTPGQTYYLHIQVHNNGGPGELIGSFHLNTFSFRFANGGQDETTAPAGWTALETTWPNLWPATARRPGAVAGGQWRRTLGHDGRHRPHRPVDLAAGPAVQLHGKLYHRDYAGGGVGRQAVGR